MVNWKGHRTRAQKFPKITAPAYQLTKLSNLMSCGSKDVFKCTNTHHDVTDLVNHGIVKNTKTWIS